MPTVPSPIAAAGDCGPTRGIARSVSWIIGLRLLALGFTLAASVITARLLGPELRGELAVMIAVPSLLAAICLVGGDTANLYFAGRSAAGHDSVVRFAWIHAAAIAGVVVLPVVAVVSAWISAPLGLPQAAFVLAVAITPVLTLVLLLGAAESGRGRATAVALLTTAAAGLWLIGIVAVALTGARSVHLIFAAFAVAQIGLGAGLVLMSWPASWRAHDPASSAYLRFAIGANASGIVLLILLRLDVPLIQALAGAHEVGLYSVAIPMAESLLLLSTAVGLVLLPAVAAGQVDQARAIRITQLSTHAALLAAVLLAAAAPIAVPLLFGAAFEPSVPVLLALLPGAVMFTAGRTLHTYLVASHALRAVTLSAALALALNIVLGVALIPTFGAFGAAVATSVAYTSFAFTHARSLARLSGRPWHAPFHWPQVQAVRAALAGLRRSTP